MAGVEQRGKRWRVSWREDGVLQRESFATAVEAEAYRTLVEAAGNRRPDLEGLHREANSPDRPVAGRPCSFTRWANFYADTLSGVRPRTLADYRRIIRRDLVPYFGEMDVSLISKEDHGAWLQSLTAAGQAPKTVNNKHALFWAIMQAACDYDPEPMRVRNPARSRLPEGGHEEMTFLTRPQFNDLLGYVREDCRPLVRTLALTGVRYGEAGGLMTQHIGLFHERPFIRIAQSLQRDDENRYVIGNPKTRKARRVISIGPTTVDDLIPLVATKERGELVFTGRDGGVLRHTNFYNRVWRPAVRAWNEANSTEVPVRIHDLRHSHVAWCIESGMPLPVIQRRLGHESIVTTIDRYGHLVPDADAEYAVKIDQMLVSA